MGLEFSSYLTILPCHFYLSISKDEESEPLNTEAYTPSTKSSNSGTWKKWTMGAALVALLGYAAMNHSSSAPWPPSVPTGDSIDLLGKHTAGIETKHSKSGKQHEEKHAMTKAEVNANLFDERRE